MTQGLFNFIQEKNKEEEKRIKLTFPKSLPIAVEYASLDIDFSG